MQVQEKKKEKKKSIESSPCTSSIKRVQSHETRSVQGVLDLMLINHLLCSPIFPSKIHESLPSLSNPRSMCLQWTSKCRLNLIKLCRYDYLSMHITSQRDKMGIELKNVRSLIGLCIFKWEAADILMFWDMQQSMVWAQAAKKCRTSWLKVSEVCRATDNVRYIFSLVDNFRYILPLVVWYLFGGSYVCNRQDLDAIFQPIDWSWWESSRCPDKSMRRKCKGRLRMSKVQGDS